MTDDEIRERAGRVEDAFARECARMPHGTAPMWGFLYQLKGIARCVERGEYHRDGCFRSALRSLGHLGFDVSGAKDALYHESQSVAEAAENAHRDAHDLWWAADVPAGMPDDSALASAIAVVGNADDLMECLVDGERDVDEWAECLHRSVSLYLDCIDAGAPAPSPDPVDHPSHYATGAPFECIDVLVETQGVEAVRAHCVCTAFTYLYRHMRKGGDEDVRKARWYLNKYVELEGAA